MSVGRLLLSALLVALIASVSPRLIRRDVSPSNPTGVHITYGLAWLNPVTGNFGATLQIGELQPSDPPTIFSIKMYFGDSKTLVQQFWGDWNITHYQSGAYHVQPGAPAADGSRNYSFNALYDVSNPVANLTFALPAAFSLLHGVEYSSNETAFMQDDINILAVAQGLPTAPFGEFIRNQPNQASTGSSASSSNNNSSSSATVPLIVGGLAGCVALLGLAGLVYVSRRRSAYKKTEGYGAIGDISAPGGGPAMKVAAAAAAGSELARKNSQKVIREPINPLIQYADTTVVTPGDGINAEELETQARDGEYYNGSGFVMVDSAAENSQRQMSFLMHYVPEPGQRIEEEEEIEGDDYEMHQQMMMNYQQQQQLQQQDIHGQFDAEGNYIVRHSYIDSGDNGAQAGEYFFAEVMDNTETSQAVPIDHAYVAQAIGDQLNDYQESPMLTLTGTGGEDLHLDDYSTNKDDSPVVKRKDSKKSPGPNYF